jgi:hypothetical protein
MCKIRGWRKFQNEEFDNFYFLPNISMMTKSSRLRYARHVAFIGAMRNAYKILKLENLEKRDYVEDLGIDG